MAWWFGHFGSNSAYIIVVALVVATAFATWFARCRHPNPHYVRAVTQPDAATGRDVVIQPARYACYECGRSWEVKQRDPAWTPTQVLRKFSGYDQSKASRAATRAAIEQQQRRYLAVNRIERPAASKPVRSRRRRSRNVIDINSRKPA